MSESFDATWLALREPADAFARDPALAERLVSLLPKRPHLLDLGAGTGSLFRWLAPMIGGVMVPPVEATASTAPAQALG